MRFMKQNKEAGFSLVELMVVVAIIGVLAALAVPRFQMFQAKARQSEAKNNLSHMYTLEESYYGDYESYSAVSPIGAELGNKTGAICNSSNEIGFKITPCAGAGSKIRYQYSTTAATGTSFAGQATSGVGTNNRVFPKCGTADRWTINEDRLLIDAAKAVISCN